MVWLPREAIFIQPNPLTANVIDLCRAEVLMSIAHDENKGLAQNPLTANQLTGAQQLVTDLSLSIPLHTATQLTNALLLNPDCSAERKSSAASPASNVKITNDESISSIFQRNVKPLKHYVSRFFSSDHDVEDVLQDVFIRVIEAERTTPIKMPKAFMYKVAKHLALNEKSKASNTRNTFLDDEEFENIADGMDLEDLIEQEQRFEHFCSSINKLPPQCKKVFIMKKVHGLSNSEIAAQLDISIGTVDKHLAKGLIDCKNDLQQMGHLFPAKKKASNKSGIGKITTKKSSAELDYTYE